MNKLFLVILLSLAFTQVQYEGNSKYYQQSLDQIDFISLKNNPLVDRDFHPMVFKFGDEYDVDISVLNLSLIHI